MEETMGAGRRLVTAAMAGVLALGSLLACTDDDDGWADDSVAAYVGDLPITEAELDAVAGDLRDEIGPQIENELEILAEDGTLTEQELADHEERRFGEMEQQVGINRTRSLEMRILTEAVIRHAEAEGLTIPEPAIEQQAFELELAEDNRYVGVVAGFFAAMAALQANTESAPPTEEDQREVYDHLVEAGLTTASFEEAQPVLTEELMGRQANLRSQLLEVVAQADVRVNPRYDLVYRVPVPVGSGESWLNVPLGEDGSD
jgi:hypothetical protein